MAAGKSERRKHPRKDLQCPVTLAGQGNQVIARTRSLNISDGGLFMTVPGEATLEVGTVLHVQFALPRSTPNTFMLEPFACDGRVVRRQPAGKGNVGAALQFSRPLDLQMDV